MQRCPRQSPARSFPAPVARVVGRLLNRFGVSLLLVEFVAGAALLVLLVPSCGAVPARAQCQLDALQSLPSDPMNATAGDAVRLIERLRSCEGGTGSDAGASR